MGKVRSFVVRGEEILSNRPVVDWVEDITDRVEHNPRQYR